MLPIYNCNIEEVFNKHILENNSLIGVVNILYYIFNKFKFNYRKKIARTCLRQSCRSITELIHCSTCSVMAETLHTFNLTYVYVCILYKHSKFT